MLIAHCGDSSASAVQAAARTGGHITTGLMVVAKPTAPIKHWRPAPITAAPGRYGGYLSPPGARQSAPKAPSIGRSTAIPRAATDVQCVPADARGHHPLACEHASAVTANRRQPDRMPAETGRTHQICVHLAQSHPLPGDAVWNRLGPRRPGCRRRLEAVLEAGLHAITCNWHPKSGKGWSSVKLPVDPSV